MFLIRDVGIPIPKEEKLPESEFRHPGWDIGISYSRWDIGIPIPIEDLTESELGHPEENPDSDRGEIAGVGTPASRRLPESEFEHPEH